MVPRDCSNSRVDLVGHVFIPGDGGVSGPVNSIRIRMNGNGFSIIRIASDGSHAEIQTVVEDIDWSANYNYKVSRLTLLSWFTSSCTDCIVFFKKNNIRSPLHVLINKNNMEVRVRESPIVRAVFDPPLTFESAFVLFALFDYNTPKNTEHYTFATGM